MIGEKMRKALNGQVNAELYSAYLYLSMAAYLESENLRGSAGWMRVQAGEELAHAMKLFDHVVERGGRVSLSAIEAPPAEWASPLATFEAVYAHEQKVTGLISKLVEAAALEGDHAAGAFLQWFVSEQVEEESSASEIVQNLKRVGESANGLLMLDQVLGRRKAD